MICVDDVNRCQLSTELGNRNGLVSGLLMRLMMWLKEKKKNPTCCIMGLELRYHSCITLSFSASVNWEQTTRQIIYVNQNYLFWLRYLQLINIIN